MALDQYRVPAELKPGRNVILVKLCQNEQTEDWAQRYQLQLRVCDASGRAASLGGDDNQPERPAMTPPPPALRGRGVGGEGVRRGDGKRDASDRRQ